MTHWTIKVIKKNVWMFLSWMCYCQFHLFSTFLIKIISNINDGILFDLSINCQTNEIRIINYHFIFLLNSQINDEFLKCNIHNNYSSVFLFVFLYFFFRFFCFVFHFLEEMLRTHFFFRLHEICVTNQLSKSIWKWNAHQRRHLNFSLESII